MLGKNVENALIYTYIYAHINTYELCFSLMCRKCQIKEVRK